MRQKYGIEKKTNVKKTPAAMIQVRAITQLLGNDLIIAVEC